MLTKSGKLYKASTRSIKNFNIGHHIKSALNKKIIENGGGHNLAAGFSIKKENIDILKKFLINIYKKEKPLLDNKYLYEVSLHAINNNFAKEINILAPYGESNLKPLFLIRNIKIIKPIIIKNKLIKCFLKSKIGKMIPAISFNYLESDLSTNLLNNKNEVDLIVQLNENFWNNKKQLQISIVDLINESNKA